ncbi:outer membrane protein TolC, putative [Lunatimonas lonarensis]|uniref:Outer membrane protein TolC, putative n=1 Tax=Lunatimonas lonarensis TaxID=1232681 RepID=R7ZV47_9BACT|nr:TolC family protein [Lunatimonas lonarensis]EON78010.1 outer membrane protein TolC, putative [Lunatimonas lonarensis]
MNKNQVILAIFLCFFFFTSASAQEPTRFTLEEIVARAKAQSPAALQAETRRENLYWRYRLFRSNYNPQLFLSGTLPRYSQEFASVTQPDGTLEFREVRQNFMDVELGLRQEIAATGGTISVNSSTNRFDNFMASNFDPQTRWSGVPLNVRLIQPIFAFNRLKWDKQIEPLVYEESKRGYVEEMEGISRRVSSMFFDFLVAQVDLEIATKNLANSEAILKIERGRYNIGTTYEDKLLQVELQVLEAKQDLARAKLQMETSSLALKSFVGLNEALTISLELPSEIPSFTINVQEAIDRAFQNRSDAIAFERERIEAESGVAQARGQRFQMNLNASYGYNNAGLAFSEIYTNPNTQALVSLGVGVPVLDWGRNKARMSQAKANQKLINYTLDQEVINFEQEIFTKVKNFEMLRDQIEITELSDQVADKRYEISFNRYQNGNVTITDLGIAQREKDQNRRAYIESLREFWTAYFEMRGLTLYDFEKGELLYNPSLE